MACMPSSKKRKFSNFFQEAKEFHEANKQQTSTVTRVDECINALSKTASAELLSEEARQVVAMCKFGHAACSEFTKIDKQVSSLWPPVIRQHLLSSLWEESGHRTVNLQDIAAWCKSGPQIGHSMDHTYLGPPTGVCYQCHSQLQMHNSPVLVKYVCSSGLVLSKYKVGLRCRSCHINYNFDRYGNRKLGYRFYDDQRDAIVATDTVLIDRVVFNMQWSFSQHAWVSFEGFAESWHDAHQLHGISEIDRRVWAHGFWWGELETELRELNRINYCFLDDSHREECMRMIDNHRKQTLYPHPPEDCTAECKARGCGKLWVTDGIWKLQFAHCMFHVKVNHQRREEICGLSLDELISQLHKGQILPTEALEAYQAKALDAHEKTNCLIGVVKDAEEIAEYLDGSEERGPLFGVPISVKGTRPLKGYPSTLGLGKFVDELSPEDCVLVKVIKKQGGVPFVRTNMPTTAMSLETSNIIFGQTVNPVDPTRTTGGSSGGEGALIGFGGSLLGIGGDIGGSIRCPAALCGICGLRPSEGRLSARSVGSAIPDYGQTAIRSVVGPMARDVDALVTAMRALCVPYMHELDPRTPPIPFNNEEYNSKKSLRIGYYTYDGHVTVAPACERAVLMAKEALEKLGHTLVAWQPQRQGDVLYMAFRAYNGAGLEMGVVNDLDGEPVDECISFFNKYGSFSRLRRFIITSLLNLTNPRKARFIEGFAATRSGADWWRLVSDIEVHVP